MEINISGTEAVIIVLSAYVGAFLPSEIVRGILSMLIVFLIIALMHNPIPAR